MVSGVVLCEAWRSGLDKHPLNNYVSAAFPLLCLNSFRLEDYQHLPVYLHLTHAEAFKGDRAFNPSKIV
jgi:hypothetical protein